MNRRNLLKSIPFLGVAPLAAAQPLIEGCPPWPLEGTLTPWQQEIWEAYNKHYYNLFILPRGVGSTFLYNRFYEIESTKNKNNDQLVCFKDQVRDRTTFAEGSDGKRYLIHNNFSWEKPTFFGGICIFTSVWKGNQELVKELVDSKRFHVLKYSLYNLKNQDGSPLADEDLRGRIEGDFGPNNKDEFRRVVLSEFV